MSGWSKIRLLDTTEQRDAGVYEEGDFVYVNGVGLSVYGAEGWGSVGGGAVLSATVTLDNDDIKALPTTRIQLVAAPGAGKVIFPVAAILLPRLIASYDTDSEETAPSLYIGTAGDEYSLLGLVGPNETQLLLGVDQASNWTGRVVQLAPVQNAVSITSAWGSESVSDFDNKALEIGAYGSGDLIQGDPANTLTVTVFYTVIEP